MEISYEIDEALDIIKLHIARYTNTRIEDITSIEYTGYPEVIKAKIKPKTDNSVPKSVPFDGGLNDA